MIGRKSHLFEASRQIDQENFGQGLLSGFRQEMPWGQDPQILVVPLMKLPHSGEIGILPLLHDRFPGLAIVRLITLQVLSLGTKQL